MKSIYLFLILISSLHASGQSKSVYGEIHLESVVYQGDTLTLNPPKTIVISKTGITPVIQVGKIKTVEIAVQYEFLKSNIGQMEYYMLGKCFYIRDIKGWKEISRFDYHKIDFDNGPQAPIPNDFQGIYASENDENDFGVGSWYVFFKK